MKYTLVTGDSSGMGLEFARQTVEQKISRTEDSGIKTFT